MPLQGKAKADYQREYKRRKRSPIGSPPDALTPYVSTFGSPSGSPQDVTPSGSPITKQRVSPVPPLGANITIRGGERSGMTGLPHRTAGKTPEECGYPEGQVEVHKGPQGQVLWRLRGFYNLPNDILCHNASHELKRSPLYTPDELRVMFPYSKYLCGAESL